MPLETIRTPPNVESDFIALEEYQSRTPETFFGGKPVLHYHASSATVALMPTDSDFKLPIFPASDGPEQKVDIFVNSENLTVFNQDARVGIQIPYPIISIHAIKKADPEGEGTAAKPSLMLQLAFPGGDEEEFNTLELIVVPPSPSEPASAAKTDGEPAATDAPTPAAVVKTLYEAVSACSSLHPDPVDDGDDEGYDDGYDEGYTDKIIFEDSIGDRHQPEALEGFSGVFMGTVNGSLPPPMPGSSGWITAENVHEHFDADGNWIRRGATADNDEEDDDVGGELGDGAGQVRSREEPAANGHDDADKGVGKKPRLE